jgi:hypothetical protein
MFIWLNSIVSAGIRNKMNSIISVNYDATNSTKQIIKNLLIVGAIKDANARVKCLKIIFYYYNRLRGK